MIQQGRCGVYTVTDGEAAILPGGGISAMSGEALELTTASRLTRESAEHEIASRAPGVGTVLRALAEGNRDARACEVFGRYLKCISLPR